MHLVNHSWEEVWSYSFYNIYHLPIRDYSEPHFHLWEALTSGEFQSPNLDEHLNFAAGLSIRNEPTQNWIHPN